MPEIGHVGQSGWQGTCEKVLTEIKVLQTLTRGNVGRQCGVNGVVIEREGMEVVKTTEERGERSGNVSVGEVE